MAYEIQPPYVYEVYQKGKIKLRRLVDWEKQIKADIDYTKVGEDVFITPFTVNWQGKKLDIQTTYIITAKNKAQGIITLQSKGEKVSFTPTEGGEWEITIRAENTMLKPYTTRWEIW